MNRRAFLASLGVVVIACESHSALDALTTMEEKENYLDLFHRGDVITLGTSSQEWVVTNVEADRVTLAPMSYKKQRMGRRQRT